MTAVPVVSATLEARTAREWRDSRWREDWVEWQGFEGRWPLLLATQSDHHRERLSVDPVFVVVDAAPDLTRHECGGIGGGQNPTDYGTGWEGWSCESRGGSGVSPVYAATWQCDEQGEWKLCPSSSCHFERRQVVEWRATDVTVLPVVDMPTPDGNYIIVFPSGQMEMWLNGRWHTDLDPYLSHLSLHPWAVDLRPGQFVLLLSGWEHLEQPHTAMACVQCRQFRESGEVLIGRSCVCSAPILPTGRVPLSVPDGVLSWIELA